MVCCSRFEVVLNMLASFAFSIATETYVQLQHDFPERTIITVINGFSLIALLKKDLVVSEGKCLNACEHG